jgi:hypothetical protein
MDACLGRAFRKNDRFLELGTVPLLPPVTVDDQAFEVPVFVEIKQALLDCALEHVARHFCLCIVSALLEEQGPLVSIFNNGLEGFFIRHHLGYFLFYPT